MTLASLHLPSSRGWFNPLDYKRGPAHAVDDDFRSPTLDAKWTVQDGAAGTVDLVEGGNVSKYDLQTRPGWLLMQAGSDGSEGVSIYQDYTLADGESVVAGVAMTAVWGVNPTKTWANNELRMALSITSGGTTPTAGGPYAWLGLEADTGAEVNDIGVRFMTDNGTGFSGEGFFPYGPYGQFAALRIARSGTTYRGFISFDGRSWLPVGSRTGYSGAPTRLWLFVLNVAAFTGGPPPIQAFRFVRIGTNDLDPWPLIG